MNGTVQNLKEAWQKMPGKTKKMIAVIAAGTIILAAAGLLVLNITIGIPVVAAISRIAPLPLDVHLMIERPIRYVDAF